MEPIPEIPPPRKSEALLIAIDTFITSDSPPTAFEKLRDAAMRLARTRLMYSFLKDDILCAVASGSSKTNNRLAAEADGGYQGIDVAHPPSTKSISAVRAITDMEQGSCATNLLNLLEVCGDLLVGNASDRAEKKRIVLFTQGTVISQSVAKTDVEDFKADCFLYKNNAIQLDVICLCSEEGEETLQKLEDHFDTQNLQEENGDEGPDLEVLLQQSAHFELSNLFAFCKATGGVIMSLTEASPLVDIPTPKVTNAVAKYRGTLNIANILLIPVKKFSFINEAKHVVGTKISWEASVKKNTLIGVDVVTQRVASAKDDSPLEPDQIVNAYPYGPDLVPEPNEVDAAAWSMHLPKGLDVLGFIKQTEVSQRYFLAQVDVVVAMPGVDGAFRLMKSLVIALHKEKMGILARSVSPARGGAPHLVYLWPRIEVDSKNVLQNFFLFCVEIAMKEDIRDLSFLSLEEPMREVQDSAADATNRYISATMLEPNDDDVTMDEDQDEDDDEFLWPLDVCNPNMDWFNICVVHRALAGPSATGFPEKTEWHRKIVDPASFVRKNRKEMLDKAMQDMKRALPVLPVQKRKKRKKRVHEALQGESASIGDFLPELSPEEMSDQEDEGDAPLGIEGSYQKDDEDSEVTDLDIEDVGEENPVRDFKKLVQDNKFNFAAQSLLVIVRRLLRDLVDDDKAMECLQELRAACVKLKKPLVFNQFIIGLVHKCRKEDAVGNRSAAFLRHIGQRGTIATAASVILPNKSSESAEGGHNYLEWVTEQVISISSKKVPEMSTSVVSM